MAKFVPFGPEEAQALKKKRTAQIDLSEYTAFLQSVPKGGGGRIAIGQEETQRVIKRRLTGAAKILGRIIKYRTGAEGEVLFTADEPVVTRQRKAK